MTDEGFAVQVINLAKRYSGKSGSLLSAFQIRDFVSAVRGSQKRNVNALDNVSFTVSHGQLFGLLGPNGAGKTTLLKILSTLVLPDSGTALVAGVDVVRKPTLALRKLQMVLSESVGFERRLTGRQNLEFFAALYSVPKNVMRTRIDELLEYFHMSEKADILFQKYSTGMGRKLLICKALLSDAPIILFDEPTSGLDPVSAAEFRKLLSDVLAKEKGKTLILSTHNLWEAQEICDTIAVLNKGRISAIGPTSEIRTTVMDNIEMTLNLFISPPQQRRLSENLREINEIISISTTEGAKIGNVTLSISASRDLDYNSFFALLNEMNIKIVSLEASQPSLEEAFFKLTKEEVAQ